MTAPLVLRNALLIDGTGAAPRPDAAVVVSDGLIREVAGPGAKAPAGAREIDLGGGCLLPGLINAHVLIGNIELRNTATAALPPGSLCPQGLPQPGNRPAVGVHDRARRRGFGSRLPRGRPPGAGPGPRLFLSVTPLSRSGGGTRVQGVGPEW
ncbi:MAG: hypothetical protein MUE48_12015 [Desulfobacterales bacterium]|nr:hypothetical protein [Desulfobacterales bacterium]